jgi:hypothetical protein
MLVSFRIYERTIKEKELSTTATHIDAKSTLNGWLQGVTGMFIADIRAIPDDKWTAAFGGCTRPTYELAADAIGLLFWVTEAIKAQGTPNVEEGMSEKLTAACNTKDGCISMLQKGTQGLSEAFMAASEETLMKTAMAPWQMESTLYSFTQIAASHIWYHDGQLNYIQCMLGDGAYHWTEH